MPKLYLTGGAVRDKLLGLPVKDYDFCCEASSFEEMKQLVISKGWDIKVERPEFVTLRAVCPKLGGVDVVLCRRDGIYSDGRRPDSVSIGSLRDDLSRRDFTTGAIAQDVETGQFIDPFNGIEDCNDRILRCVGKSEERMAEDSLRLLRAIRLSVTKSFEIHWNIEDLLRTQRVVNLLDNISAERVYDELVKMFKFDTVKSLAALEEYPLIKNYVFDKEKFGIWLMPSLKKS